MEPIISNGSFSRAIQRKNISCFAEGIGMAKRLEGTEKVRFVMLDSETFRE